MADALSRALVLTNEGRFEAALQTLREDSRGASATLPSVRIATLELLERTARLSEAEQLLETLASQSRLDASERARVAIVSGLVAKHYGHIAEAHDQFLRACQHAEQSSSRELLAWAQLRLLGVAAEGTSGDSIESFRSQLGRSVERAGSPNVSIAFHVFSAEYEAKHGQLQSSKHHGELAESLLSRHPNWWLRGLLELQQSCLSYLEGEFSLAIGFARSALRTADDSGHVHTRLVALADMAAAYLASGQPNRANSCLERAMAEASPDEQLYGLLLETLAEAQLESRDLGGCEASLRRAEAIAQLRQQRRSSWHRSWNLRTRLRLMQRRGKWNESLALVRADAHPLSPGGSFAVSQVRVLEVVSLGRTGAIQSATHSLLALLSRPVDASPLLQGLAQFAVASVLASQNPPDLALSQYSRALRILAATGESSCLVEAVDSYIDTLQRCRHSSGTDSSAERSVTLWRPIQVQCHLGNATPLFSAVADRFAELSAFMSSIADLVAEPKVLGEEALRTLSTLGWIQRGEVVQVFADGRRSLIVSTQARGSECDCTFEQGSAADELLVPLGMKAGDRFELRMAPARTFDGAVGCGAVVRLLRGLIRDAGSTERHAGPSNRTDGTEVVNGRPGIFRSPAMISLVEAAKRIAAQDITVLLTGESGTGKEVIAGLIHESSGVAGRPFVVFNCATIPTDMVESQLFGYRRGAFTGAVDSFKGVIRAAEGGTLFLDEVAELPLATQPKLLRFLDSFEIQPLGQAMPQRVNVRVVAATNADLEQRVAEGRFRADLFYRLNVVHFRLPPLRERREEIRPLAECFLTRCSHEMGKPDLAFRDDTLEHLLLRPWPGNVRQLLHEIRRVAAMVDSGTRIRPQDLDPSGESRGASRPSLPTEGGKSVCVRIDRSLAETISEVESAALRSALNDAGGRNEEAARRLGLSRKGLYLKRRRLGIEIDDPADRRLS